MNRKEMVLKLSDFFGVKHKYLGAPSFAYEIKIENQTYTIDRSGTIKNSDGEKLTLDSILRGELVEDEMLAKESTLVNGFEVKLPFENHSGVTLNNIVNMLSSKQKLIMKVFNSEEIMDDNFAKELSAKETATIDAFKDAINNVGTERCKGLSFDFEEKTMTFKLKAVELTPEKIEAFTELVVLINQLSKKLKRASFKEAQEDNPKYAFRTWIIRLGMIGKEYKGIRKVLLSNLEGSAAFRKIPDESGVENNE